MENADKELLLKLLAGCMSLVDAAHATEALSEKYASYADAVAAPFVELQAVRALGERGANLLKCIQTTAIRLATVPLRAAPLLENPARLHEYLNMTVARDKREIYHVLFLDAKNFLIADEVLAEGVENWVHVSVRETARRSIQHGATGLILVHNHPSGDPTPSESDLYTTRQIEVAMKMLGVRVHDHIIVGKGQMCSLRQLDFFT